MLTRTAATRLVKYILAMDARETEEIGNAKGLKKSGKRRDLQKKLLEDVGCQVTIELYR